jgi:spore coat polysaccharide biosynthesis predicted glycosyltransferase SpsG
MKILAIISLGIGVGSGHFSRTLKLINELKKRDNKVLFIFNKKEKFENLDKNFKFDFTNFRNKNIILDKISEFNPNLIILDSYIISYDLNKKIYELNKNIISIDDNLSKKHICKYYINYNFVDKKLKMKFSQKIHSKNNFIGPKYFFSDHFNSKNKKSKKNQVLIFLGSTNENNILGKILPIFRDKSFDNFEFKIISGRFNNKKLKNLGIKKLKIYRSLPQKEYLNLLSNSEFYVTSGGVSAWEGLVFKKKMLVISTANNQLNNLRHLKENKLINYIGASKNFNYKKNKKNIIDFFFKKTSNSLIRNMNKFKIAKKFKHMTNVIKRNYEI